LLRDEIKRLIDQSRRDILGDLARLVNIQSGTTNPAGVNRVIDWCQEALEPLGVVGQRKPQKNFGAHLVARSRPAKGARILVIGHADTVFGPDEPRRTFASREAKCFGPGVFDMKAGLICLIHGLKALLRIKGRLDNQLTVIINADEEVGSPSSRPFIETEAKKADLGLIMEPALGRWRVVTSRGGSARYGLTVRGRAAHVCRRQKGVSAVHELAHKILALEQLTDLERETLVTVGLVNGGVARNMVPPLAHATIDLRFRTNEDGADLRRRIEEVARTSFLPGARTRLRGGSGRPPMISTPATQELFAFLKNLAAQNGWRLRQGHNSGVGDANFTSRAGLPTVDGLGPHGNHAHSEREFIYTESLFERCRFIGQILAADLGPLSAKLRDEARRPGKGRSDF